MWTPQKCKGSFSAMLQMKMLPYSYFWLCGYFWGSLVSFFMTDKFWILFESCCMWIFPWIKPAWYFCSMRDRLGWLSWFWQFLCEGLSGPEIIILQLSDILSGYARGYVIHLMLLKKFWNVGTYKHRQIFVFL